MCFEGVEKLLHKWLHRHEGHAADDVVADSLTDESAKIKGAIRTDFILSAEIIIIALGVVEQASLPVKIAALTGVGIGITFAVYGLVAAIVKADDLGFYLMRRASAVQRFIGRVIIAIVPWFMRGLAVVGTLAMFMVGGGIFTHKVEMLHKIEWGNALYALGFDVLVGLAVGAACCAVVLPLGKWWAKKSA